ncbi:cytochrome P450 4d1-like [Musca vetustissima]|uniref:cytochrome P450 4d1-like n=1 Tax=Musca vetustissima TaxID=27455 RepID=UPI002AB5DFE4|nr:cytochrome P450 4d1-like [Musca vetustissima]
MLTIIFDIIQYILTSLILISVTGLIIYFVKFKHMIDVTRNIPSPPSTPILGHSLIFNRLQPHEHAEFYLNLVATYGKTFKFLLGPKLFIVLTEPNDVEVILNDIRFIEKSEVYSVLEPWFKEGLMNSPGHKWQKRRKILTQAFHFRILKEFVEIFDQQSRIFVENLWKEYQRQGDDGIDLHKWLDMWALDVLCESSMGVSINAQTKAGCEYLRAVKIMSKITYKRIVDIRYFFNAYFRFTRLYQESKEALSILRKFTEDVIKKRRLEISKHSKPKDQTDDPFENNKPKLVFLDTLLTAQQDGKPLTNEDIHEEVNSIMFGGHDSTSLTLLFLYYNLSRNPQCQKKCYEEILEVMGDKDGNVSYESLNSLNYMDKCIKETLRIFPAVPLIARQAREECEINGKMIPSGATIVIPNLVMGRQEDIFPNALEFKPERFNVDENSPKLHPYASIPFSAGPRNCLGYKYAMLEMKTILVKSLRHFEFECLGDKIENIQVIPELVLRPRETLRFKIKPRVKKIID